MPRSYSNSIGCCYNFHFIPRRLERELNIDWHFLSCISISAAISFSVLSWDCQTTKWHLAPLALYMTKTFNARILLATEKRRLAGDFHIFLLFLISLPFPFLDYTKLHGTEREIPARFIRGFVFHDENWPYLKVGLVLRSVWREREHERRVNRMRNDGKYAHCEREAEATWMEWKKSLCIDSRLWQCCKH